MNPMSYALLQTYAGMNQARANSFVAAMRGEHVHPATMAHFRQHDLIDAVGEITARGYRHYQLVTSILGGSYTPESPLIPPDVMTHLNLMRAVHIASVKQAGLRAVQLKILRSTIITPGMCYAALLLAFTYSQIDGLIKKGFLNSELNQKYTPVHITESGLDLVKQVLAISIGRPS